MHRTSEERELLGQLLSHQKRSAYCTLDLQQRQSRYAVFHQIPIPLQVSCHKQPMRAVSRWIVVGEISKTSQRIFLKKGSGASMPKEGFFLLSESTESCINLKGECSSDILPLKLTETTSVL